MKLKCVPEIKEYYRVDSSSADSSNIRQETVKFLSQYHLIKRLLIRQIINRRLYLIQRQDSVSRPVLFLARIERVQLHKIRRGENKALVSVSSPLVTIRSDVHIGMCGLFFSPLIYQSRHVCSTHVICPPPPPSAGCNQQPWRQRCHIWGSRRGQIETTAHMQRLSGGRGRERGGDRDFTQ